MPSFLASKLLLLLSIIASNAFAFDLDQGGEFKVVTQRFQQTHVLKSGQTYQGTIDDVVDAAAQVVPAYNNIQKNVNDPLQRHLTNIVVTSVKILSTNRRHLRGKDVNFENSFDADDVKVLAVLDAIDGNRSIPINFTAFDDHHRNLGRRTFLRVHLTVYGTCKNCYSGATLINEASNRRLSTDRYVPSASRLRTEQNTRISQSQNPLVDEVSELWAQALSLAIEAQVAAENANVHRAHVQELSYATEAARAQFESQVRLLRGMRTERDAAVRRLNNLKSDGAPWWKIRDAQALVNKLNKQVDDIESKKKEFDGALNRLDRSLRTAQTDLNDAVTRASNLANRAASAEKKALDAERKVYWKPRNKAKSLNKVLVSQIKF